jgi:uncharacterized protein YbjT (DUF2867 family)
METRTAIVFGATGLVGKSLVEQLLKSPDYNKIVLFVRRSSGTAGSGKISEHLTDFSKLDSYSADIIGDDLFICLGTTIKKAGSIQKMEEIDRDLPVNISLAASKNGVKRVAVISSVGADSESSNNYLRIKGEMENGIMALNFESIAIARPSILYGNRNEKRIGETIGKAFMKTFGLFLRGKFAKYKGIEGRDVANAMISILREHRGIKIFESDILQKFAK